MSAGYAGRRDARLARASQFFVVSKSKIAPLPQHKWLEVLMRFELSGTEVRVLHADHGISEAHLRAVLHVLSLDARDESVFVRSTTLPPELEGIKSALYGPAAGDPPVLHDEAYLEVRGDREGPSRLVRRLQRATRLMTVIGRGSRDGHLDIFTAYGGPPALREPWDPTLTPSEKEDAEAFWAEHALASNW